MILKRKIKTVSIPKYIYRCDDDDIVLSCLDNSICDECFDCPFRQRPLRGTVKVTWTFRRV